MRVCVQDEDEDEEEEEEEEEETAPPTQQATYLLQSESRTVAT